MHSAATTVGRLVEVRVVSPVTDTDGAEWLTVMHDAFAKIPGKSVVCLDMRGVVILSPVVADYTVKVIRSDNRLIERSAVLLAANSQATFGLQIERAVREAGNPNRKTFRNVPQLLEWLGPVLTVDELERTVAFLDEYRP